VLLQALGERSDLDIAEVAPRLKGVFLDLVDGELEQRGVRGLGLGARECSIRSSSS
jgi:hypothetical protein